MDYRLLWFLPAVMLIGVITYFTIGWYKDHPCIQEESYCYYNQTSLATGVGQVIGGKGGVAVSVSSVTVKVYIDCKDTKITPEEISIETRCVLRK